MSELTIIPQNNAESYRASTDAASLCRDIVVATATNIQGRSYVTVEGWQAIAIAHGCTAGARDVERVEGGVRAIGEIRRMSDGVVISVAEGFVGEDEPTWYGGQSRGKTLPKRADYAIRAMAQTRAISRACRSAFAHVVVMMKANLSTTPAEEVPYGGFEDAPRQVEQEARSGPVKLDGPYTSPTALKTAYQQLDRDIRACESGEELEQLLEKPASVALIDQMKRDAKGYVFGSDKLPPEHVPLMALISRTRTELMAQDEAAEREGGIHNLRDVSGNRVPITAAG